MRRIEEGKKLVKEICKVMEWNGVRDLICECFADGATFTNEWAEGWRATRKLTFDEQEIYQELDCIEDKLAYLWSIDNLEFIDIESEDVVTVTMDNFYNGVSIMNEKSPRLFDQFIDDIFDGITCDALLQYAVYGDLIYG